MTDFTRGYECGLAVLAIKELCSAATALESAANWLSRSEKAGALVNADRLRIAVFASVANEALASIRKSLPTEQVKETAQ